MWRQRARRRCSVGDDNDASNRKHEIALIAVIGLIVVLMIVYAFLGV